MNEKNTPNNQEQEVDILVLFDYFKNGIKALFKGIGNLISWIFYRLLDLIILLKKNWIIVIFSIIIFTVLGYVNSHFTSKKYTYNMIVKTNYNSGLDLYKTISYLNEKNKDKINAGEDTWIQSMEIVPVKRMSDMVDLYYLNTKNTELSGMPNKYSDDRDTIFFTSVTLDDFSDNLLDVEYPYHEVKVKTFKQIPTQPLEENILNAFSEEGGYWAVKVKNKKQRLESKIAVIKNSIQRADSLLSLYAKEKSPKENNTSINLSGQATNNVEADVFDILNMLNSQLEITALELDNTKDIVEVISKLKRVEDESLRSYIDVKSGILIGILVGILIVLLFQFNKYLSKYDSQKSNV